MFPHLFNTFFGRNSQMGTWKVKAVPGICFQLGNRERIRIVNTISKLVSEISRTSRREDLPWPIYRLLCPPHHGSESILSGIVFC